MIEVHPNPEESVSDGDQSLKPDAFKKLVKAMDRENHCEVSKKF